MKTLTNKIGVYALCDLDGIPVYVGQSKDGIQARVRRHLTSARSDIIANRQVDPWEIAFVHAYPVDRNAEIPILEASLFAKFHEEKPLMNGSIPVARGRLLKRLPQPAEIIQMMPNEEIKVRKDPALRLPRQIEHIGRLVDHILTVKDSAQLRRSLAAHFDRLDAYRGAFLKAGAVITRGAGEDEDDEA
ncbi:MAG TPA: GIY-YIG nuclease family protein [Candidatus Acidoferrales bacterium]|nr:GIY-YIG nuclease family protein [Candidatus Acidoferrales bacterium]